MANDTTPDKIRSIAKHLRSLSDGDLNLYIEDAKAELDEEKIPDKYRERLQRYLSAHLASLNVRRVASQKVDGMSQTFSNSDRTSVESMGLDSTPYGQEFARLMKKYTSRPSLKLTVF